MTLKNWSKRSALIRLLCFILIISSLLGGCEKDTSWTGTPVKVLVVLVQWNNTPNCSYIDECKPTFSEDDLDDIHEPRHTGAEYITIMDERINTYYQQATFGKTYFDFELLDPPTGTRRTSIAGWWDSPYTLEYINKHHLEFKQVAVSIAYTALGEDIYKYDRILFVSNIQHRGGQACTIHNSLPFYPVKCSWDGTKIDVPSIIIPQIPMIVAEVGEGEDDTVLITVAAHELGHMLGAADQYYGGNTGMGMWDLMGDDSFFFHFGAWTKLDRGWLDWNANTTRMPCDSGDCEITTTLDPVELMGNNALLIPVGQSFGEALGSAIGSVDGEGLGSTFVGIMAECRKRINGDEAIPEEGVLVSFSNPFMNDALAGTVSEVLTNESNHYALLQPGETYINQTYNVQISNISSTGEPTCTVKATRSGTTIPSAPDMYIGQGSVTTGGLFDRYTSPDIFNDSSINGQLTYPSSELLTNVLTVDGWLPVPNGYGDPVEASPSWPNTAWAIIQNRGTVVASDIVVSIYFRQPLVATIQTTDCGAPADSSYGDPALAPRLLETFTIPELAPGQIKAIYTYYQTNSTAPLEITVVIDPVVGEVDVTNNRANETYTRFYGQPGMDSVADVMQLGVSENCLTGLPFQAMEVPAEDGTTCAAFDLSIYPPSGFIMPGEDVNFSITVTPSDSANPGDVCNSQFSIMMPINGIYNEVESFSFEARVVEPATLTCSTPPGSSAPGTPVLVNGLLNPALGDTIGLLYTDPDGNSQQSNTFTNLDGQYSDQFTPSLAGLWNVQAFWVGNETHGETQSTACQFLVEENAAPPVVVLPTFKADTAANCRERPSTFFGAVGFTVIGSDYPITGIPDVPGWFRIALTNSVSCYVSATTGQTSGDLSGVPLLNVDIITPTPPVSQPPASYCSQFTSFGICGISHSDRCTWLGGPAGSGPCVDK
jgi:M6 family metalloprotease-like protein